MMSLYISINTASSTLTQSPINDAITFVAVHAALEKQQGALPDGPALDVTFLLPGEFESPDFDGMRMGGYTHEGDTLFFETAVPRHIIKSDEAPRYVALVMQDVVEHANEFFAEQDIRFDVGHWRRAIATLTQTENVTSMALN